MTEARAHQDLADFFRERHLGFDDARAHGVRRAARPLEQRAFVVARGVERDLPELVALRLRT